jgi:hypothetical protein
MASDRSNQTIDLRGKFSYSGDFAAGSACRFYDVSSAGILGDIGDTLVWQTPQGAVRGAVIKTGWENLPLPTRWVDVVIARG